MNGQLILLLLTLLLQGQNGAAYPPGTSDLGRGLTSAGSSECDIGYATDPNDGKYCMIVQIHPSAMAAFVGQELPVPIRSDYRPYVEKVIIRVGTGLVENTPPTQAKMSENRTNNPAFLADLKNRTPVNIDRNSDLLNASAQSGLGPSGLGPSGLGNNDAVMPPTSDKSRMPGSLGGGSGPANSNILPNNNQLPNASVMPNNNLLPANSSPFPGSNRQSELDSFGAPPPTASYPDPTPKAPLYNPIKPAQTAVNSNNNLPNSPFQSPSGLNNNPSSPSYASSGNNPNGVGYGMGSNYGNNSNSSLAGNGGINNGYGANGTNGNPFPSVANNPNANNYNPQTPNQNPVSFPSQPASFTQNQNFGALPTTGPSYGATPYQPPPQTTSFAGTGNLEPRSSSNQLSNRPAGLNEDQNIGRESMLPFLLLFSIVGNVYLGLWMNHLRKRYRELRISMRGLPVSELA